MLRQQCFEALKKRSTLTLAEEEIVYSRLLPVEHLESEVGRESIGFQINFGRVKQS